MKYNPNAIHSAFAGCLLVPATSKDPEAGALQ